MKARKSRLEKMSLEGLRTLRETYKRDLRAVRAEIKKRIAIKE